MYNFPIHRLQFLFLGFSCGFSPYDRAQNLLRNLICLFIILSDNDHFYYVLSDIVDDMCHDILLLINSPSYCAVRI